MKYCPQCNRQFEEVWLSFCPDDGTPLVHELTPARDPNWDPNIRPPKVEEPPPPSEQETQWLPRDQPMPGAWIAPDERPPMAPGAWTPPQPPYTPPINKQPSQGLAIASMITAIAGVVTAGCFGPLPGIVALIMGLIALSQIKREPDKYGGKPFATAGVIIGAISMAFYVLLLLFVILSRGFG